MVRPQPSPSIAYSALHGWEMSVMPRPLDEVVEAIFAGRVPTNFEQRTDPPSSELMTLEAEMDGFFVTLIGRVDRSGRWVRIVDATAEPVGRS